MAKRKPMTPTTEQAERMKRDGIHFPFLWVVVGDFTRSFVVTNVITGATKVIYMD